MATYVKGLPAYWLTHQNTNWLVRVVFQVPTQHGKTMGQIGPKIGKQKLNTLQMDLAVLEWPKLPIY